MWYKSHFTLFPYNLVLHSTPPKETLWQMRFLHLHAWEHQLKKSLCGSWEIKLEFFNGGGAWKINLAPRLYKYDIILSQLVLPETVSQTNEVKIIVPFRWYRRPIFSNSSFWGKLLKETLRTKVPLRSLVEWTRFPNCLCLCLRNDIDKSSYLYAWNSQKNGRQ